MLIYLLLAGAILIGWFIRVATARFVNLPVIPIWLKSSLALIAVAGVLLSLHSNQYLVQAKAWHTWPTASAVVTSSEIVGERAYRPLITFEYKVGDSVTRATSDMNAPGFGGKRKRFEVAEAIVKEYPPGTTFIVRYDPNNPAHAQTSPLPTWNRYAQTGLGIFMLLVAAFLVTCPTRK